MPYALFTNDEQISKAYRTKQEVWKKADEAGLVVEVSSDEDKPPVQMLDEDYHIEPCDADPADENGDSENIARNRSRAD